MTIFIYYIDAIRKCMPDRILFLDASEGTLRQHKLNDLSRSRSFFRKISNKNVGP